MDLPVLVHSSGYVRIDNILQGIISLFEIVFPGRIRGYYLVGSRADNSAVDSSDIDIRLIFKEDFLDKQEIERFLQVRQACRSISPYEIDLPVLSEARLQAEEWLHEIIIIKSQGVFLYGEDTRASWPTPEFEAYLQDVTHAPILFFSMMHGKPPVLTYPLDYPDGKGEFFGYDQPDGYDKAPSTKMLVHIVGFAATCLVGLLAGKMVMKKSDWLAAYRAEIHDYWTPFLENVYETCKLDWKYQIPEAAQQRFQLRELCRQTLYFENDYLTHYRDYLLENLRATEEARRAFALKRFKEINYPDPQIISALQTLENQGSER